MRLIDFCYVPEDYSFRRRRSERFQDVVRVVFLGTARGIEVSVLVRDNECNRVFRDLGGQGETGTTLFLARLCGEKHDHWRARGGQAPSLSNIWKCFVTTGDPLLQSVVDTQTHLSFVCRSGPRLPLLPFMILSHMLGQSQDHLEAYKAVFAGPVQRQAQYGFGLIGKEAIPIVRRVVEESGSGPAP